MSSPDTLSTSTPECWSFQTLTLSPLFRKLRPSHSTKQLTAQPPASPRPIRKYLAISLASTLFIVALVILIAIAATSNRPSLPPDDPGSTGSLPTDNSPTPDPVPSSTPPTPPTNLQPTPAPPAPTLFASPTPPPSDSPTSLDVTFQDRTAPLGVRQPTAEPFGGATVADLDRDGDYDLILTYHNDRQIRIYFSNNTNNLTYIRDPFGFRADIHGVAVAPRTAISSQRVIVVSLGGGRGTNLRIPRSFSVSSDRTIQNVTLNIGLEQVATRGRIPLFLNLRSNSSMDLRISGGGPDVLFINLLGVDTTLRQFAYENTWGTYRLRRVPGFENVNEERAILTDIENDGVMELVHFSLLAIFRITFPFGFRDVTREVWPDVERRGMRRSISAVVELDFNNDGFMDLYLARADPTLVTQRGPASVPETDDVLLMNNGGTGYVDVSRDMELPRGTDSMAVSAADFNNDGYVDVMIATFMGPDILLMNEGGERFVSVDPQTQKAGTTRGNNIVAVDLDRDGRVDYIEGQGFRKEFLGNFRIMKNEMELNGMRNYLHVRVGIERNRSCTELNALVTVTVVIPSRGRQRMVRRVGGRGAQAGGLSLLDTVHFGLGAALSAESVEVRWTNGMIETMTNVVANQRVQFGLL